MTLTNKTEYHLTSDEARAIMEAIQSGDKFAVIQGDYVMLSAIVAIQAESRLDVADKRRRGDYKCVHGLWHAFGDRCYGHDAAEITARTENLRRLEEAKRSLAL